MEGGQVVLALAVERIVARQLVHLKPGVEYGVGDLRIGEVPYAIEVAAAVGPAFTPVLVPEAALAFTIERQAVREIPRRARHGPACLRFMFEVFYRLDLVLGARVRSHAIEPIGRRLEISNLPDVQARTGPFPRLFEHLLGGSYEPPHPVLEGVEDGKGTVFVSPEEDLALRHVGEGEIPLVGDEVRDLLYGGDGVLAPVLELGHASPERFAVHGRGPDAELLGKLLCLAYHPVMDAEVPFVMHPDAKGMGVSVRLLSRRLEPHVSQGVAVLLLPEEVGMALEEKGPGPYALLADQVVSAQGFYRYPCAVGIALFLRQQEPLNQGGHAGVGVSAKPDYPAH